MYSIHGLLVSETDFAYYIPLYNASHFLDSLLVCSAQALSRISERGRAASLGFWVMLPWVEVQFRDSGSGWALSGKEVGGGILDTREHPERFQRESAENFSPELKETSKLTK